MPPLAAEHPSTVDRARKSPAHRRLLHKPSLWMEWRPPHEPLTDGRHRGTPNGRREPTQGTTMGSHNAVATHIHAETQGTAANHPAPPTDEPKSNQTDLTHPAPCTCTPAGPKPANHPKTLSPQPPFAPQRPASAREAGVRPSELPAAPRGPDLDQGRRRVAGRVYIAVVPLHSAGPSHSSSAATPRVHLTPPMGKLPRAVRIRVEERRAPAASHR